MNEVTSVLHFNAQIRETEIILYAILDVAISAAVPMLNGTTTCHRSDQRFSGCVRASGAVVVNRRITKDTRKLKIVTLKG
jgi:hypothetical protein